MHKQVNMEAKYKSSLKSGKSELWPNLGGDKQSLSSACLEHLCGVYSLDGVNPKMKYVNKPKFDK